MSFTHCELVGGLKALVGKVVEGWYPAANYEGVRPRMERRRVLVEAVRDMEAEPVSKLTMDLDPLLRRRGALMTGIDLDLQKPRSFYIGAMDQIEVREAAIEVEPPNGKFEVLIAEQLEHGLATIAPAGFSSDTPDRCKIWASGFNDRELVEPVNAWAVVRKNAA